MDDYNRGGHSKYSMKVHIIFVTKYIKGRLLYILYILRGRKKWVSQHGLSAHFIVTARVINNFRKATN